MGYLSCNVESAIFTCDPYNSSKKKPKQFKIKNFNYADLETATACFSQSNFLGKGSHGSVYRAVFDRGDLIAAVKRHRSNTVITQSHYPTTMSSPADNEIETLSQIRSPRLVNLLGFASDPIDGKKLIVVEYMPNGSLYDLLHKNEAIPPSLAKRVRIAVQVAKAVHHLHTSNPPVIHRDIKSSNVLFDGKWNARLGDFGLALRGHLEDVKVRCTPPAGTLGYLDPCYLVPGDLTAKSDVFSFGILLLELISGRNAIDMRYSPPSVVDWAAPSIKSGDYGEIFDRNIEISSDESVVRKLAVLAARCVKSTAEKRPAMAEVVECLIAARKRISSVVWRRVRITSPSHAPKLIKYEPLIEVNEMVKACRGSSRLDRKVSAATNVTIKNDGEISGGDVARSKSIGSGLDVKSGPLDGKRTGAMGLCVRRSMGRMNRSKSTGELQKNGGIVLQMIRNPNVRELESSKLLVKFSCYL